MAEASTTTPKRPTEGYFYESRGNISRPANWIGGATILVFSHLVAPPTIKIAWQHDGNENAGHKKENQPKKNKEYQHCKDNKVRPIKTWACPGTGTGISIRNRASFHLSWEMDWGGWMIGGWTLVTPNTRPASCGGENIRACCVFTHSISVPIFGNRWINNYKFITSFYKLGEGSLIWFEVK